MIPTNAPVAPAILSNSKDESTASFIAPKQLKVQKLMFSLKSEWSREYIYWTDTLAAYRKIIAAGTLKGTHGKVKLQVLARQLQELMNMDFVQIQEELDLLVEVVHNEKELEAGFEFSERYWELQDTVQHFRNQARMVQLEMLQHVNRHLPLFIY